MKIVVCVKHVPDTTATLEIAPNQKTIETEDLEWVMNPYDEYAVEEAVRLKERFGGEVTVLSLGDEEAENIVLTALAMGADRGIILQPEEPITDPYLIAKVLAGKLSEMEFDIVLFGKRSIDYNNHQVGTMVAELLGIPSVSSVNKLEILDGKVRARREIEGGAAEIVEVEMPVVITAEKDLNQPRYVSFRGLALARRKPIEYEDVEVEGEEGLEIEKLEYPPEKKPGRIVGEGPEAVPLLVKLLREEAKVI